MKKKKDYHDHFDLPGAGAKARKDAPCDEKFGVVMAEFYSGTLRSGGSGEVVTNVRQAKAIAASETRKCYSGKKS